MIIIYVNCALFPFIDWIIKGKKKYETRNRNTLKRFIGKQVYLAETGKGKRPVVRCCCMISDPVIVTDKKSYNRYRKQAMIKPGSIYDFSSSTKRKVLYPLSSVKSVKSFVVPNNAIRHGYTWCEIIEK